METQTNNTKARLSPGFFFLSLGLLISLITVVVSFLNLVFSTLDKKFPDVLNGVYQYGYSTYDFDSIRISLATLIIFFPVFIAISYFWRKFTKGDMGSIDEIIKKWVLYIILFFSSLVVVIDLVVLVRFFVGGEITNRFIYKVIATFVVAVLIGKNYYISQIWNGSLKWKKIFSLVYTIFAFLIVVFSIMYSFSVMGSPAKQRMLRLDDRRVSDLQSIQYQIINFWQQKEKLPNELKELSNGMTGFYLPVDPEFEKGKTYEYKPTGKMSFEICSTFSLEMQKGWQEYNRGGISSMPANMETKVDTATSNIYPMGGVNESWDHGVGRVCFERTIDKDIYPPFKN